MAEGKATRINANAGYGFITPDGGGEEVFFRLDWVKNPPAGGIQQGTRLSFESIMGDKGPRAKWVRFTGTEGSAVLQPDQVVERGKRGYRFLNPYNFVRSPRLPQVLSDQPGTILLSRCLPPPHDRWVGLNGTIACELEAVTPLFVSDSEHWEDKDSGHGTYQFYKFDFGNGLEPALPASSLRGMIRSEFEAVTNSCMAHFEYNHRLSYHLPANDALKLVPARVEHDPEGRWWLRLLPGTAQLVVGEKPRGKLYAGRVEKYKALSYAGRRRPPPELSEVNLKGLKHGDHCFAQVEELNFPPVWNVVNLAKTAAELGRSGGHIVDGYLCINNQNIETKRFERFFFRNPPNKFGPEKVLLNEDVRQKYRDLIKDYQTRHAVEIAKWHKHGQAPDKVWIKPDGQGRLQKNAAFSRFVIGGPCEVKNEDLVYAMLSGSVQNPQVEFIVPVAVPRVSYQRKVDDLLPSHLWKCQDFKNLCPACRTFGWVHGSDKPIPVTDVTAYAGRLRFTHGQLLGEAAKMDNVDLAILGSPKPTTTYFYLRPAHGKPRKGQDEKQASYDNSENVLRGRKLYRHHGHTGDKTYWLDNENKLEFRSKMKKNSEQNRTVRDALQPGTRFRFSIHFENLAPTELGALLWVLGLENKGYHRLGYAKPLGFGSMRLSTLQVNLVNMEERYQSELHSGEHAASDKEQQAWIDSFKSGMSLAYEAPFDELPHIRELLALLGEPPEDLPIHYPRTEVIPSPEGKNFEWFVGNKRNRDARFTLELPGEEKGLPLIDKTGQIKA